MIRRPKIELYSNEHVEKVFFMVKSFVKFYLIQHHKNAFHDELFLSAYSILKMELHFPGLVNHSYISALAWIESVAKKRRVPKKIKQLVRKFSTKINLQLAKFTFKAISF